MCFMPRVTYAAEVGGTLSADVESGRRVDFGRTITIAAIASVGFNLMEWQGDGSHCAAGDLECVVTVVSDVSVSASFLRDCAGEIGRRVRRMMFAGSACPAWQGDGRLVLFGGGRLRRATAAGGLHGAGGSFRENGAVCAGVDAHGTFCILDSVGAFPCRDCSGGFCGAT